MKYLLITILSLAPISVSATQSVHHDVNLPYDCTITGLPQDIQWIKKGDKSGNKQIKLKWYDSKDAHDVEVEIDGQVQTIPDDGTQTIKGFKKNSYHLFRMRGVSNCGEGNWTKIYKLKA